MRSRFLVTGATGFIGSRFASLAVERGHEVRTLSRSDWSEEPAVLVSQRYFGTFPDRIPAEALHGVEGVVHCAAVSEPGDRASYAVNVDGTLNLARMAIAAGIKSFIFLSSRSAQPDAVSAYGRSKYAAEQALLALDGINVVILRPDLTCGPGRGGLFQRMCSLVEQLPFLPLPGGGRHIVQPIHVDDLCEAIFTCAARSAELAGSVLCLGDETGVSLAEFLQAIAVARLGRRKLGLYIPLWPVKLALKMAESLHLSLPIHSGNLAGMEVTRRIETGADMVLLGLRLRSIDGTLKKNGVPLGSGKLLGFDRRAVRGLIIGAGRAGLVHAITASRLPGIDLKGLVDSKRRALNLLQGIGLQTPSYASLDEALSHVEVDAAVIAVPPSSHLSLARACLGKKLHVLIEKPVAVLPSQLAEYRRLPVQFPDVAIQAGYLMPRNPQVSLCIERLKAGEYGKVTGFMGFTLISLIQQHEPRRWEVKKDISGGGVLISAGGHVLSMIHAAWGEPVSIESQSLKLHSTEVEDSMMSTFAYPDFTGMHFCSWSIREFPRQENKLVIWTDCGQLTLTGSVGVFIKKGGEVDVRHQLDFEVGFNLAPDYAGAGFSTELNDLKSAVRTGKTPPMDIARAVAVEAVLFQIYANAESVKRFLVEQTLVNRVSRDVPAQNLRLEADVRVDIAPAVKRVIDLRDLSPRIVRHYFSGLDGCSGSDEYQVTASQIAGIPPIWLKTARLRVTIPDFYQHMRLLSGGRYIEVLRNMGSRGVLSAGLAALTGIISERGSKFWAVIEGLLAADLARLPRWYNGTVLLHSYVTDLALVLDRRPTLERIMNRCRRLRPHARIGFHTNLASEAVGAGSMWDVQLDEISVLTSPWGRGLRKNISLLRQTGEKPPMLTAEVGLAPAAVHNVAARDPGRWTHGADAILLGAFADKRLAELLKAEKEDAWSEVFPGLKMPEAVL